MTRQSTRMYNAFLKKAYIEADIDTIRAIRRLVEENQL